MARTLQLVFLLSAVLCSQSVLSLKCYVCKSVSDPECLQSPPPARFLEECSTDTLEVLNDMHRQTKLEEAAQQAAHNPDNASNVPPMDIQPGTEDPFAAPRPPAAHPFDKDDKDLALNPNRTARSVENAAANGSEGEELAKVAAAPQPHHPMPPAPVPVPMSVPKEATFCRKISYHIPAQSNGPNSTMAASVRVHRSCGWIPEEKKEGDQSMQTGCKWIGTDGTQMNQCVCTGDGCNPANLLASLTSQTLVVLAVITAGYFYVL